MPSFNYYGVLNLRICKHTHAHTRNNTYTWIYLLMFLTINHSSHISFTWKNVCGIYGAINTNNFFAKRKQIVTIIMNNWYELNNPSKHKVVVTTFSQHRAFDCFDIVSLLEMMLSPESVDNAVAKLRSGVVATFWQRSANVVTLLQSCSFTKCVTTSFQSQIRFS